MQMQTDLRTRLMTRTGLTLSPVGSGRQTFLLFIDHRVRATDDIPVLFASSVREAAYQEAWVGLV